MFSLFFHFVAGNTAIAWDINSSWNSREIFLHQFAMFTFSIHKFICFSLPPTFQKKTANGFYLCFKIVFSIKQMEESLNTCWDIFIYHFDCRLWKIENISNMSTVQRSPVSPLDVTFCSCYWRRRNKNSKYSMSHHKIKFNEFYRRE